MNELEIAWQVIGILNILNDYDYLSMHNWDILYDPTNNEYHIGDTLDDHIKLSFKEAEAAANTLVNEE